MSVVVVASDDHASSVDESLDTVRDQTHALLEVLVVPFGGRATVSDLVARHAREDWRVRVLPPAPTRSAGHAAGAAAARGRYLLFMDGGETLPRTAVATLCASLEASGSDLAVGGRSPAVTATHPARVPALVTSTALASRMFRRSFWTRVGLGFPAEGEAAPWTPAVEAYLRCTTLDAVAEATWAPHPRGSAAVFGAMVDTTGELAAAVATHRRILDGLAGARWSDAREAWLRWVLDEDVIGYVDDAERLGPTQWRLLRDHVADLLAEAGPAVLEEVRAESRVKCWLTAHDHRDHLVDLVAERWFEDGQYPTEVRDGRVYAELPTYRKPDPGVPDEWFLVHEPESPLFASLRRMRWAGPGALELELFAYVERVPFGDRDPGASVALVDGRGRRTALEVRHGRDPEVNLVAGDRYHDFSRGVITARVDVSELLDGPGTPEDGPLRWRLEVALRVGELERTATVTRHDPRGSAGGLPSRTVEGWSVTVDLDARRGVHVMAAPPDASQPEEEPRPVVRDVDLEGDRLRVRGRLTGPAPDGCRVELRGADVVLGAELAPGAEDFDVTVRLAHDPWGLGESAVPTGLYRLGLAGAGRTRLVLAQELTEQVPLVLRGETFRARLRRALDGQLLVNLGAPLADDEVGPYAQAELQRWYADEDHKLDDSIVYLQSYTGETATDSPLAIHHELRRTRPDLTLYWGVADSRTRLPEGAVPVLIRSREWYEVLARARHIVTNIEMDRWFATRPGQELLQTFHGYPSKTMGIGLWRAKEFTPRRIEAMLDRTSRNWTLLLTPTPDMDRYYRENYRYDGRILAEGYPRDDALVSPSAPTVREETRRRLGLRDGQTAVLYAPTWRDDLATNFRSAPMVTHLDVERASTELGDDFVLLLRGHRFHARRKEGRPGSGRLVDVTDYPEVDDLILAADATVLDYSSMRFDFALTGRPMLFLVPDLDQYTGGVRGFLYDFPSSAPGPLLSTTDEVIAGLRDLDGVSERYAAAYERFNREYNRFQDGRAAERAVRAFFGM